jgi:hypothetical protein
LEKVVVGASAFVSRIARGWSYKDVLVKVNATVREFSEGSLLLELCRLFGVLCEGSLVSTVSFRCVFCCV